jgi:hypothetical protein
MLMRCVRLAGLFVAAAFAALLLLAGPAHADTVSDQQQFVADINQLRASKGLGALTIDANLTNVALGWAQKMADDGNISHNPSLRDLITSNWYKLGENVGFGPTVDTVFRAFVNSPHHYANLIDPSFTHVGVGVVFRGTTMYTSHEFMQLRSGASSASATTAPRRKVTPPPSVPRTTVAAAPKPTVPAPSTTLPPAPAATAPWDWLRFMLEMVERFDPTHLPGGVGQQ